MPTSTTYATASVFNVCLRRRRRRRCVEHLSRKGRRPNLNRDFLGAYKRFYRMYLTKDPIYTSYQFRRCFRMSRSHFLKIVRDVSEYDPYFTWKCDATGKKGVHPVVKVATALRMLAYGVSADLLDERFAIAESTVNRHFVSAIIAVCGSVHLRLPTSCDLRTTLKLNAARGFPGMMGSIDWMKWERKNCPSSWHGAFQGASKRPTVVLEAIATSHLHIWHAFVGMPGSHNDLNILHTSPLIAEYVDKRAPIFECSINGKNYTSMYWLADGIYPNWQCFVKTIAAPVGPKQKYFAQAQEVVRKDIECAFGVLQARFYIVARPAMHWDLAFVNDIMKCCIILHNMIIDDDKLHNIRQPKPIYASMAGAGGYNRHRFKCRRLSSSDSVPISFVERYSRVINSALHFQLKNDFVEHIWNSTH